METAADQVSSRKARVASAAASLLDRTAVLARDLDRSDLVARVESAQVRVTDPRIRIVVVGPLNQGKSQFVNSLLGCDVCSVGDDETTAVATVVQYGKLLAQSWFSPNLVVNLGEFRCRSTSCSALRRQQHVPMGVRFFASTSSCRAHCWPTGWSSSIRRASEVTEIRMLLELWA